MTEAVVFGTASRLRSADTTGGVKVAGTSLQFSDIVKLLGVELDQALSMNRHVHSVVSSCNFHIRALSYIRSRLTFAAAKSVAVIDGFNRRPFSRNHYIWCDHIPCTFGCTGAA